MNKIAYKAKMNKLRPSPRNDLFEMGCCESGIFLIFSTKSTTEDGLLIMLEKRKKWKIAAEFLQFSAHFCEKVKNDVYKTKFFDIETLQSFFWSPQKTRILPTRKIDKTLFVRHLMRFKIAF